MEAGVKFFLTNTVSMIQTGALEDRFEKRVERTDP